ncbi:MAG: hypothetical protein GWM98_26435, partial [Nitrospinaceae bacterium]|nr:DUF4129 domain-containing protein [Nitrospinaceae bacterium]NIR57362.1 DUF4129 domain-containing protein [Nitrospinaceae bacterium]NIS87814.1 DUF4129 domain-containing protein [Nitrospinaceae bacterium]NIU46863.1 DUF4129 domain-containing protein [Nitrospinaceae bacterium]NIU99065.1 hypothetical protein [Nitrospinaceae bacterium]
MVNQVRNLRSLDPEAMFQWIEEHAHWILILLGLGGILYLVRSPVGRTGRWRLRNDPFPVRLYTEMLRRVEKLGYSKPPGWTHREFLDRLSSLPEEQYQTVQRI